MFSRCSRVKAYCKIWVSVGPEAAEAVELPPSFILLAAGAAEAPRAASKGIKAETFILIDLKERVGVEKLKVKL